MGNNRRKLKRNAFHFFLLCVLFFGLANEAKSKEKIDALVFDSPTILYYAHNKGAGKVSVIGPLFDIQYYGFLFPQGSKLREPINRALLRLRKNGIYDRLHSKWFGSY